MEILVGIIFLIAIVCALQLYSAIAWGVVLYKFWSWFLIPVLAFYDVNIGQLPFWLGIGLLFFLTFFKGKSYEKNEHSTIDWVMLFLAPWISLVMGWFIHIVINWQMTVN
jgi:hypothetical protein